MVQPPDPAILSTISIVTLDECNEVPSDLPQFKFDDRQACRLGQQRGESFERQHIGELE